MNNYDLHKKAQDLSDTHSAYELARMLVENEEYTEELLADIQDFEEDIRMLEKEISEYVDNQPPI